MTGLRARALEQTVQVHIPALPLISYATLGLGFFFYKVRILTLPNLLGGCEDLHI